MSKKWVKRGAYNSISAAIHALSSMSEIELTAPEDIAPEQIENMAIAGERIRQAIKDKESIFVFGDYDADGVCSLAILFLLLKKMGAAPSIRVPKRMSEGYGLSEAAVDEVDTGLLITVDNGISALGAVRKAKDKGLTVIVLDHHLPSAELPPADIIVDPYVHPERNGYVEFCGGGLAYKLAQMLLPETEAVLLHKLCALAAIATIADVVPLTGANRVIVRDGLNAINRREVTKGLNALLSACQFTVINEDNIAFKLAPILNAAGRLYDDGARFSSGCLAQDEKDVPGLAAALLEANAARKELVASAYRRITDTLDDDLKAPLVVYDATLHEGIVGIVAGRIADDYKMPAYVFTGRGPVLRGSGRSAGGVHLRDLTAKAEGVLSSYGGHAGAVGLEVPLENFDDFCDLLKSELEDYDFSDANTLFYDVVISPENVCDAIQELSRYAPYGEHNPKPVFLIQNISLCRRFGGYAKYMGENGEHVKLTALGYSLVGFGLSSLYKLQKEPAKVDVIGRLGTNESIYGSYPQVEIIDIRPATK